METFFRKYFWTAHLVFIFLMALIAAKTINLFVESLILPPPREEAPRAAVRRAADPVAQLNLERIATLTGLPLPKEPEVREPDEPTLDPNAPPVKSGLRVKLLGTLAAAVGRWSIATILDLATQRAQTYGIGDKVLGAEVLEIMRERVIVLNNNRREYISNDMDGAVTAAYVPPEPRRIGPGEPASSGPASGIKRLSDSEYDVPKTEIDRHLSNLNELAMQARIVPAYKDGQAQGFKLFSIRPDSLYTKIGIQNGDVIKRINGNDINSPEKALEIYSRLREASRIDIEIERNGTPLRKTYNVR